MKRTLLLCLAVVGMLCVGNVRALALERDRYGVYQINSVDDMLDFADMVNYEGRTNASAALNTDLDMLGVYYLPIGCESSTYRGTFDGQCHYINNLYIDLNADGNEDYLGVFGAVTAGAHIKNLIVGGGDNAYIGGREFVAGIVGGTIGSGSVTIENCGNEAWIYTSGANAAGIFGVNMDTAATITIINCYNTGYIQGSLESAAISGWLGNNATVTNCWNTGTVSSRGIDEDNAFARYNNNATFINCWDSMCMQSGINEINSAMLATLSTGEFCYQTLNAKETENVAWYQTLGVDEHPVPFSTHGVVYAVGSLNCDGTPKDGESSYSNEEDSTSTRDPHNFVDGFCSFCGTIDVDYLTPDADGYYNLGSSADLYWFAVYTKSDDTRGLNARLTADINYEKMEEIGSELYHYGGTFDGQGHTVTISFIYSTKQDRCALFDTTENATVENLTVDGVITTGGTFAGGIECEAYSGTIRNCVAKVHIESSYDGDGTHAGICAIARNYLLIENCAFVGELNAPYSYGSAGVIGYVHNEHNTAIINTYVAGNLTLLQGNNNANVARNNPRLINVWVSSTCNHYDVLSGEQYFDDEVELVSGKLCYLLNEGNSNGVWHQTLGTDDYPVPFDSSEVVYAHGTLTCGGEAEGTITFDNDNTEGVLTYAAHEYGSDGICVNCHNAYQISNTDQLLTFSNDVTSGSATTAYAELTTDLDLSGVNYVAIGARTDEGGYPYAGTFDGKGHKISNMNISTTASYQGFFGVVTDGAHIKNLIIDNTCSVIIYGGTERGYAAGLIGATQDYGRVYIENCGSEANVSISGANAAGLLGVVDLGHVIVYMTNCYCTGNISGNIESAALCGWLGEYSEVTNCWSSCTVYGLSGTNTFYRNTTGTVLTNCYETLGTQVTNVTNEAVASGELAYKLNNGETEDVAWYQTIGTDEHPVFDASHGIVYYDWQTCTYTNDATGIEQTVAAPSSSEVSAIYSVDGMRLTTMQKGINIVRMADGSVRKVLVK